MSLKTDYKDAILASGTLRKYQLINNDDGTVSLQDVSEYSQVGDNGQASVFNATNGEVNAHKADYASHITALTCVTSGTVHALTGLSATSGLAPCVFKADAAYVAGDTFTVGGTAYAVITSGGETLRAGAFLSGDIVGIRLDIDNKKLYIRQESKAQVGLPNVDNTADANKSVLYAQTSGTSADTQTVSSALTMASGGTVPSGTLSPGKLWAGY